MTHLLTLFGALAATMILSSAHAAAPAASVGVAQVVRGELADEVTLVGSAVPRRSAVVSAQVAGQITELRVDRGTHVEQGQELFRLDDALARFDLDSAAAELAEAQAEVSETRRKQEEAERLRAQGHIPQSALETAQTAAAVALARRDERKAGLGRARTLLDRHVVKAPFSGTVVEKSADVGQWIRSDSSVLTLVETDPARIEVPVPQDVFSRLDAGAGAYVVFESLPGERFDSRVGARVPQGSDAARTFPVWLEVDNDAGLIAPGMSARVTLMMSETPRPVLLVPSDALVRRADGSTLIWLVEEDSESDGQLIARAVSVQVGDTRNGRSQIDGVGVEVGDRVVVRGNEGLRPNQRVQIVSGAMGR